MNTFWNIGTEKQILTDGSAVYNIVISDGETIVKLAAIDAKHCDNLATDIQKYTVGFEFS